jgi:hypothetical protein
MAQITWQYINKQDTAYFVSLYHGDKSGHLLLYSGKQIISIDFSIKANKTYSFLLGEELMECKILFNNAKPTYKLFNTVSKSEIYTHENYPKRHIFKAIGLIVGLLLVSMLVWKLIVHI